MTCESLKAIVIIPVKNEADSIERCLTSLLAQTYRDFEIVVADDGSTDGTVEIVTSYSKREQGKIRLTFAPQRGPGEARNTGSKLSNGEILIFIDGDETVNQEFISLCMRHFKNPKTAGVFVSMEFDSRRMLGKVQDAWKKLRWRESLSRFPRVIRRSCFQEVGGYNPKLTIGEDFDLWVKLQKYAEKNGYSFAAEENAVIYHADEDPLLKAFRRALWYGRNLITFLQCHPRFAGPILLWSLFNASLIVTIPLILFPPLRWLATMYLLLYVLFWAGYITNAVIGKRGVHIGPYGLLVPFLQIWIGLGVVLGIARQLIKPS